MNKTKFIAKGPCPIPGCECHYPKKDGTICDFANVVRLEAQNVRLRDALQGLMLYYVGERGSHNILGEAGVAADRARAILRDLGEAE